MTKTIFAQPDLSVIIVNFNGASYLAACLDSILASQTNYALEIIVIDNASQDHSRQVLAAFSDRLQVILNTDNLGFAAANNQGLRLAQGRYVMLLNNDTLCPPTSLDKMLTYYDQHPELGGLGPQLLNADGTHQIPGSILTAWRYRTTQPRTVSFLSGAAFLTTRALLEQIQGLDENFFFYNEDTDLCLRLSKLGYPLLYFPAASITHFGGQATQTRALASFVEGYRGGMYLCLKHYGSAIYYLYRLILLFDLLPRSLFAGLLALWQKERRPYAKTYFKLIFISLKKTPAKQK